MLQYSIILATVVVILLIIVDRLLAFFLLAPGLGTAVTSCEIISKQQTPTFGQSVEQVCAVIYLVCNKTYRGWLENVFPVDDDGSKTSPLCFVPPTRCSLSCSI